LERTIANSLLGFKKPAVGSAPRKSDFIKSDKFIRDKFVVSLRGRVLAFAFFMYFFIESGTLGLVPQRFYLIYRNVRISDIIMFGLVIYSVFCIREFWNLYKSRAFLITKLLLVYLIFEFVTSSLRYEFNLFEYAFRLKGLWASLLVLPYMLLLKRDGLGFLIKLIFPVAIISNVLYVLTALTGIAFLPDVSVITQQLPGDLVVYRVYGGTFYGETFFLGFIYLWVTKKFRLWQLFLVILFITPQVLAFGRNAWAYYVFTILVFIVINFLNRKDFKLLLRQGIIIGFLALTFLISFMNFIPDSGYYVEAVWARITQGQEDVKYSEGTYGTRILFQNNALVGLWMHSDLLIGIGMHPMWVVRPESFEEQVYYSAFSDVAWPATLAAYGLIGFVLALAFQIFYIITSWRLIRKAQESNIVVFFLIMVFAKLIFETFVNFSYVFISVGLWGLYPILNFYVAIIVERYEAQKLKDFGSEEDKSIPIKMLSRILDAKNRRK
jgi:hypothetical protein